MATVEERLIRLERDIGIIGANVNNLTVQSDYKIRRLEGDLEDLRAEIRKLKGEQ